MAKLAVEVVDTPSALAHGLMFRRDLPRDSGMLFKFPNQTEAHFWGKNTYLPLDVAFVNANNEITEIRNIVPMSTRIIHSNALCKMAIEANAGYFEENGIKPGHIVELKDQIIEFKEC